MVSCLVVYLILKNLQPGGLMKPPLMGTTSPSGRNEGLSYAIGLSSKRPFNMNGCDHVHKVHVRRRVHQGASGP